MQINNLLISKISATCFVQSFTHLQERKTEIFTAYVILQRWIYHKEHIPIPEDGEMNFSVTCVTK
jgi:hypothetical protein